MKVYWYNMTTHEDNDEELNTEDQVTVEHDWESATTNNQGKRK